MKHDRMLAADAVGQETAIITIARRQSPWPSIISGAVGIACLASVATFALVAA